MSTENRIRGVLRIADLYARSERRPGSDCWHWRGAMASDSTSPRIWTFDHDRGDKRCLSGPRAVWNIAHQAGLRGKLAFMRCVNSSCVNPVHVGSAWTKAEIGAHIALNGKRKGTHTEARRLNASKGWAANCITPTPAATVLRVRAMTGTSTAIALALGMTHQTVSRIRRGDSHRHLLEAA